MIPRFTDHSANERTYLAWVRTAIAVMAFGFLIERFDLFLAFAAAERARALPALHVRLSELVGLGLILVGALMTLLATRRYRRNRQLIAEEELHEYSGAAPEGVLATLVVIVAIFLVGYVAQQLIAIA